MVRMPWYILYQTSVSVCKLTATGIPQLKSHRLFFSWTYNLYCLMMTLLLQKMLQRRFWNVKLYVPRLKGKTLRNRISEFPSTNTVYKELVP